MNINNQFSINQSLNKHLHIHIWYALISIFISHGLLDFITFIPNIANNGAIYLTCIIVYTISMFYVPSIGLLLFIGASMYHFGEDFDYVLNKINNKENHINKWCGVMIFSSSVIVNYNIWIETISWLGVNSEIIVIGIGLMSIPAFITLFVNSKVGLIISLFIGLNGVFPSLILYSCIIHSPLGIYRFIENENNKIKKYLYLIIFVVSTIIIYNVLPYVLDLITPKIFNIMIGVVVSHIIFITKWQLKHPEIIDNILKYKPDV